MTGPYQSGKSSIVRFHDPDAVCVEADGRNGIRTTVAMDVGHAESKGVEVTLVGTPGMMRFSEIREILLEGADGVLFVFDAACPEKDDAAISILNQVRRRVGPDVPVVYLAHKSDFPEARPARVICMQNYLPKCVIFETSVHDDRLKEALDAVVEMALERYSFHLSLLSKFEGNWEALAQELKYSDEEMREYLGVLERKRLVVLDHERKLFRLLVRV
ncbi:MAG: hypothetical protein Kow0069_25080 [Promethearchaeota archaeon]